MSSRAPSSGLLLYIGLVFAAGAALLLWSATRPEPWWTDTGVLLFWLFFSLAAECFWLRTPTGEGMVSMSLTANLAMLFVLPLSYVVPIGFLSVGLSDLLLHRRGPLRAVFNASQTAISLTLAYVVLRATTGMDGMAGVPLFLQSPGAMLAAAAVFFAANTLLVAGVIALHTNARFFSTWKRNYGFWYQALSSATLSALAVILVFAYEAVGFVSGLLFLMFFYFIRDAYHRFIRERLRSHGGA
ncbi:MAG: hypothetical protein GF346_13185 [Candidatus Eisenbacteria bacterium]|nr:hypothetical protein [Candidatus Latescibacterota bacterium]MBD3303393.1 hypothetical protein [Candidatus Eisenbacteria bacterium]